MKPLEEALRRRRRLAAVAPFSLRRSPGAACALCQVPLEGARFFGMPIDALVVSPTTHQVLMRSEEPPR